MNNTRKITAMLLAILMLVSCVMLSACTKKGTDTSSADEASTATADSAPVTNAADEKKFAVLKDSYKPAMAFDLTGKSVDLAQVYGSGFKKHGGELCFKEDGTFTAYIGVYGNANDVTGTYKVLSMTEIELKYNNDTTVNAVITATDVDGNAVEIRIPESDYNVIFQ